MTYKNIAIIPARSGSKGVKNKNIRIVCGKPLVAYTLEAALASKKIDQIIVSTDSLDVVEIAKSYGISVPYLRPAEFAQDSSTDFDVLTHALNCFVNVNYSSHGSIVYLRPTTPFKSGKLIDDCIAKLSLDIDSPALRTVTQVSASENPAWQYIKKDNLMKPICIEGVKDRPVRRQDLPEIYKVNGLVDIVRYSDKKIPNNLFWAAKTFYTTSHEISHDIDDELDLAYCEFLMERKWKN